MFIISFILIIRNNSHRSRNNLIKKVKYTKTIIHNKIIIIILLNKVVH